MATDTADLPVDRNTDGDSDSELPAHTSRQDALRRIRTAGSISISPELFEKLYLSPQNAVKGDLRKTFGNPTPLALIGFLVALTPLSAQLMGWRGTGGPGVGSATIGTYFFFGGLLLILSAVGEWILGNTFPLVVFGSYGAFWLSFGATLQPFYNAWGAYATNPSNPASGLATPDFLASLGFFFLTMGFLSFIYMICSLRTNAAFFTIFLTLTVAFSLLTGEYFQLAKGNAAMAAKLQTVAGGFLFVTNVAGWYLCFAILLASLDFPFSLPVGDLSHIVRGASQRVHVNGNKV